MATVNLSVNPVVLMYVLETVLLRARIHVLKNAHLHVQGNVCIPVKRRVGRLVMVVARVQVIKHVKSVQNEIKNIKYFNSVFSLLLELHWTKHLFSRNYIP